MIKTIQIQGGFHNARPITMRLKGPHMSIGQAKRLTKHMCPVKDCICGTRDWWVTGAPEDIVLAAYFDADLKAYFARGMK